MRMNLNLGNEWTRSEKDLGRNILDIKFRIRKFKVPDMVGSGSKVLGSMYMFIDIMGSG
jgi:hypothetical protein